MNINLILNPYNCSYGITCHNLFNFQIHLKSAPKNPSMYTFKEKVYNPVFLYNIISHMFVKNFDDYMGGPGLKLLVL